jgi:hypothetical protein
MSVAVFPNRIAAALDRLTVPPLPDGFGDRLAARVAANDLPDEQGLADVALPHLRRPTGNTGWRRSGRIVFVAAAFGLATATAAASGVFGDAVYVPVVSDVLARAELVKMPDKKPPSKPIVQAKIASGEVPQESVAQPLMGKDLVLARIAELRADPDYRNLTRLERQERSKIEIGKLLADGIVQKADVKAAWTQLALERQAAKQTRVAQGLPDRPKRLAEEKRQARAVRAKPLTPEQREKVRAAVNQLTEAQRAELQVLRQRRRDATPQERRAVQAEIRAFWQRTGTKPDAEVAKTEAR